MNRLLPIRAVLLLILCTGCSSLPRTDLGERTHCQSSETESRQVVLEFYEQALVDLQPRAAFERYVADSFVEHKPDVPEGTKAAAILFLEELIAGMPEPKWEIVRTIAENELVFVHARFTPAVGAQPYAIADVFRLHNCKIVEHWDVVAGPSKDARNPHPRF